VTSLPDRSQRLLRFQRGVIATWQADRADISPRQMENLVRAGPQAILSHETAAELHGLLDKADKRIHVCVPQPQHMQPVPGLVIHRSSRIREARDPGRMPPRTMIDETVLDLVQAAATFDDVIALLARACQRRLTTPFLLSESLDLRAKSRWRGEINLALRDVADGPVPARRRARARAACRGPAGRRDTARTPRPT
jgi:hypothetical protein